VENTIDLIKLQSYKKANLIDQPGNQIALITHFPFHTGRHSRFQLYPSGPKTLACP